MVNTELRILRVFGPTAAEVSAVLRQARADGCPGLRLLERDGEFAVCVQVSAPNRAMAEQYCEKWVQRLRAKFGDDVFATGETSLAQATLDTLLEKRKLLVTADETTGRLVGALLQPLPHSEAVFDFGTESYADPEKQKQITVPPQLLKKFPGDVVQAAAGRALAAMQAAAAQFIGTHDFSALCASGSSAAAHGDTVRTITDCTVVQNGDLFTISVTADGYLYNMVRILAGTLADAGLGKRTPESIPALLESGDRRRAGPTLPAKGLFLEKVDYPELDDV